MPFARLLPVRTCQSIVAAVLLLGALAGLDTAAYSEIPVRMAVIAHPKQASARSSSRRTKCIVETHARKHRRPAKSCASKKPKPSRVRPRGAGSRVYRKGSGKGSGSRQSPLPSVGFPPPQAPVNGGVPPAGPPASIGPKAGALPGAPGSPDLPPGESTAPSEQISPSEPAVPGEPMAPGEAAAPFRFFASTSVWNEPVPAGAPLDPSSATLVGALNSEVTAELTAGNGPWINTAKYSVPVYTVAADQPTVAVTLDHSPAVPALQSAWSAVPLPQSAHPASGTDAVLVVWQPSTDRLWEFEKLVYASDGWRATWGGAMQNVSSNTGVYTASAWSGAQTWWGASASSLSLAGGLISLEDLEMGQIDHALAMAIPNVSKGVYASPAQRDDGTSTSPLSLPEGAHLRLNPNLDLATLHLPPVTLMIAQAAQRYGIFIRDKGANVQLFAQDPTPTGTNPYAGRGGYFEGKSPAQLLAAFPWSELELLKMELHAGT
jgi:hypothetical protein